MYSPEIVRAQEVTSEFGRDRISIAAEYALWRFAELTHTVETNGGRAIEHPKRVCDILGDFTHFELDSLVYDAAALHDIAQIATDEDDMKRINARRVLKSYSGMIPVDNNNENGSNVPTRWEYISNILSDLDDIEDVAESYRNHATDNTVLATVLKSSGDISIQSDLWAIEPKLTDPNDIIELLKNVNVESVLIKAAEALDNLRNPSKKDRSVLQDVFEAESFFAPVLEVMGYEGFASAVRSQAKCIRLEKTGEQSTLNAARELLGKIGGREAVLGHVSYLLGRVLPGESVSEHAVTNNSSHDTIVGRSLLVSTDLSKADMNVYWRLKTEGSTGYKMLKHQGQEPGDMLGLTIEVQTLPDLEVAYNGLIKAIKANGIVRERPAPGRKKSYCIQGFPSYITQVSEALDTEVIDVQREVEQKEKSNGHQVAKVTFDFKIDDAENPLYIPVEIMVQTVADRKACQIDEASHTIYKLGKWEGDYSVLADIRERRQRINSKTLNGQSLGRGKEFRKMIDSVPFAA